MWAKIFADTPKSFTSKRISRRRRWHLQTRRVESEPDDQIPERTAIARSKLRELVAKPITRAAATACRGKSSPVLLVNEARRDQLRSMDQRLSTYRLYYLTDARGIVGSEVAELLTDDDALAWAEQFRDGKDMEVWTGARIVATIPKLG